ncbi:hypothetical protein M0802_016976 [Mischocyttarus mexicanus]|nr:hypothetical protein M0802_016976 [Mischocyttarus mexicanus]
MITILIVLYDLLFKESIREQPVTILTCNQWEPGQNKDPQSVTALVTLWKTACRIARINSPTAVLCQMTIEKECDICLAVKSIKQFRPDFIKSVKDMEFLYDAALEYMRSLETYANFS